VRRRLRFDERVRAAHEVAIVGHVNVWDAFDDACLQHRERHALKRTSRHDDQVRPSYCAEDGVLVAQIRFHKPHSVLVTGIFDAVGRARSNLYPCRRAPKQFVDNDAAEKTVAAVHDNALRS
jgi:hypothetical protein